MPTTTTATCLDIVNLIARAAQVSPSYSRWTTTVGAALEAYSATASDEEVLLVRRALGGGTYARTMTIDEARTIARARLNA